jgi:hypothetical protein
MQSLAQVRKVYDKDTATIWEGQCAIKMMCQIQSTEEQKWASTLVGEREIERYSRSMSMSATGGQATQHTSNYQRVREPLMLPSDFQDRLSADSSGAQAIFTSGAIRARIHVPRIDTSKQREMVVPASWLTRGYDRPIWGAKPPKVDLPDLPEIEDDARKPSAVMTPQPRPQRTPTVVPATPDQPAKKATENKDGGAGEEVADHIVEHVAMRALGIGAVATAILEAAGIVMENKGPTAAPLKVRRVPAQMADGSRPAANEEDERDREQ